MIIVPRDEKESALDKFYIIRDKFKDEYKDTSDIELMISVLEHDDETLLDKMSLEGCAYFFRFVDYKYYYDIFVGLLFEIFNSDKDEIKKTYITTNLIPSKLLNDEDFLEVILKQSDEILDMFHYYKFDLTSLDVLCKILNRMSTIDCDFFKIQCDSKKSFIAQNADYSKKIVESDKFIENSRYIESIYLRKIYNNCKKEFLDFSIEDKIALVDKIDNKNFQKELFDCFDLKKYPSRLTPSLVSLLDKNTLIDKIINGDYNYISYLNSNEQLELLNDDRVNVSSIAGYLNDDVIISNLSNNPSIIPPSLYIRVYNNGRNIKIEEYLKELLLNAKYIDDDSIIISLMDSSLIKSFSDKEVDELLKKIRKIEHPLALFYLDKVSNERLYNGLLDLIFKKVDFKGTNQKIKLSLGELIKYPQEYREKILENLDKNYLIGCCLSDNEEFKMLCELLKWNENYFDDELFEDERIIETNDSNNFDKKYLLLKEYLNEKQINNLFYSNQTILNNSKIIKSEFITYVSDDVDKISSVSVVKFLPKNMHNEILKNMPINIFVETIPYDFDKYFDSNIIDERYNEIIKYVSLHNVVVYTIEYVYKLFNDTNKNKFINDVSFDFAFYIYKNSIHDKVDKKRVFRNLFSTKERLLDFDENTFVSFGLDEYEYFVQVASLGNIVSACLITDNKYLKDIFGERIKENFDLLLDPLVYTQIDNLIDLLDEEVVSYIKETSLKELDNYGFYYNLKKKEELTLGSLLSIIYGRNKSYINDDNTAYLYGMYSKDKYFFANLDFRLLRNDIYSIGDRLVSKLVRYPNVVNEIYNIFNSDKYDELKNILLYLDDIDISSEVYSHILDIVIYYCNTNTEKNDYNNPAALIDYIISSNVSVENLLSKLKFDNNYLKSKEKIIDYWIQKNTELDELKNLVYQKIYGVSSGAVRGVINKFKTDCESIQEYLDGSFCNIYMSIQEAIEELENIDEIHKFCNEVKTRYTAMDYYIFEDNMKKAYCKLIEKQNNDKQPLTDKNTIEIADNSIEVEEYINNFGIFTHSTCAYGNMRLIDDDYYISWNNNPCTNNNGICTAYITNSNMSTAPISGDGVLFGFTNIKSDSIGLYAPYDLNSVTSLFGLYNSNNEHYVSLNNLPSYTRHTHNEIVLYRKMNNINLQPDCVIIFEDMPEKIKMNSLKAVEDFKQHGIDLKIVYIDRIKVLSNEVVSLAHDIKEYLYTYDLELLEKILNRYNTNMCSLIYLDNVDNDELFITDTIKQLLEDTIEHIISIDDPNLKSSEIIGFVDLINNEQIKYDLLKDNFTGPCNKFDLYTLDLKEKIKDLEKMLLNNYKKRIGLSK